MAITSRQFASLCMLYQRSQPNGCMLADRPRALLTPQRAPAAWCLHSRQASQVAEAAIITHRRTYSHSTQRHRRGSTTITGAARSTGATLSRTSPPAAKPDASRGEPLLVLEDVAKSHDGDTQLFQDVSVTVCRGDRLAVVGTNGSGATSHVSRRLHDTASEERQIAAIAASAADAACP